MQGPDSSRHSLSVALEPRQKHLEEDTVEAAGGKNRPDSENVSHIPPSQVGSRRIFYAMLRREINGEIKRMKRQV